MGAREVTLGATITFHRPLRDDDEGVVEVAQSVLDAICKYEDKYGLAESYGEGAERVYPAVVKVEVDTGVHQVVYLYK